jgi:hypothetical protein
LVTKPSRRKSKSYWLNRRRSGRKEMYSHAARMN